MPTLNGAAVITTVAILPEGMTPKAQSTLLPTVVTLPCDVETETNCRPVNAKVPSRGQGVAGAEVGHRQCVS
jgi:hypothetical protein